MSLFTWFTRTARRKGAIDKAKYHHGNGAETEEDGAYHIGLFLRFCAERGLASAQHQQRAQQLAADPARYLVAKCAAMLVPEDLSPEGQGFAERVYSQYLTEVADMAMLGGDGGAYTLRSNPKRAGLEQLLFEYLDSRLAKHRGA